MKDISLKNESASHNFSLKGNQQMLWTLYPSQYLPQRHRTQTGQSLEISSADESTASRSRSSRTLRSSLPYKVFVAQLTHSFMRSISSRKVPCKSCCGLSSPQSKESITNFRPNSFVPIPQKILEILVFDSIKPNLLKLYSFWVEAHAHLIIHDHLIRQLDHFEVKGVAETSAKLLIISRMYVCSRRWRIYQCMHSKEFSALTF